MVAAQFHRRWFASEYTGRHLKFPFLRVWAGNMEISGNENGNKNVSWLRKYVFVGEFEDGRKLVERGFEETSRPFLGVEVSIRISRVAVSHKSSIFKIEK